MEQSLREAQQALVEPLQVHVHRQQLDTTPKYACIPMIRGEFEEILLFKTLVNRKD